MQCMYNCRCDHRDDTTYIFFWGLGGGGDFGRQHFVVVSMEDWLVGGGGEGLTTLESWGGCCSSKLEWHFLHCKEDLIDRNFNLPPPSFAAHR